MAATEISSLALNLYKSIVLAIKWFLSLNSVKYKALNIFEVKACQISFKVHTKILDTGFIYPLQA